MNMHDSNTAVSSVKSVTSATSDTFVSSDILFEGMTSVSAVIKSISDGISGRKINVVYIAESNIEKKRRKVAFLTDISDKIGFKTEIVPDAEFDKIASGKTHGGFAALCSERSFSPVEENNLPKKGIYALLDGVEDPFTLAYSLRSLYAAGFDGVVLPDRSWKDREAMICKSSAGASELMHVFVEDTLSAAGKFKNAGYSIVCAGIRDSVSFYDADLTSPLLLVIGGEKRGISAHVLEMADSIVRIDYGRHFKGSLTTECSVSILAFEISKRNLTGI